jgi:hypothetical protein
VSESHSVSVSESVSVPVVIAGAVVVSVSVTATVTVSVSSPFPIRDGPVGADVPSFDIVRFDGVIVAGETPAQHGILHRINAKGGNRRARPMNIGAPQRRQATLTSKFPAQAGVSGPGPYRSAAIHCRNPFPPTTVSVCCYSWYLGRSTTPLGSRLQPNGPVDDPMESRQ